MNFRSRQYFSRCTLGVAALGAALGSGQAGAATSTGSLAVSTTVLTSCLIGSGTLAFGNYDPTSATATTASTTVVLTCTPGTAYDIGVDAGGGSGATVSARKLSLLTNTLGYQLFRDSGYTLNWGNTVGTDTLHGTTSATLLTNTITVYGRIPAGEAAATGAYADTVTVTVTY